MYLSQEVRLTIDFLEYAALSTWRVHQFLWEFQLNRCHEAQAEDMENYYKLVINIMKIKAY